MKTRKSIRAFAVTMGLLASIGVAAGGCTNTDETNASLLDLAGSTASGLAETFLTQFVTDLRSRSAPDLDLPISQQRH